MVETAQPAPGRVRIGKHTRFVHGIFHDLRSCGMGHGGKIHTGKWLIAPEGGNFMKTIPTRMLAGKGTIRTIDQPPSRWIFSQQRFKFLLGNPCLFEYVRKRGSFDGTMRWNGQLEQFYPRMLMQTNMTSSLADDDPPVPL